MANATIDDPVLMLGRSPEDPATSKCEYFNGFSEVN